MMMFMIYLSLMLYYLFLHILRPPPTNHFFSRSSVLFNFTSHQFLLLHTQHYRHNSSGSYLFVCVYVCYELIIIIASIIIIFINCQIKIAVYFIFYIILAHSIIIIIYFKLRRAMHWYCHPFFSHISFAFVRAILCTMHTFKIWCYWCGCCCCCFCAYQASAIIFHFRVNNTIYNNEFVY